MSKQTNKNQKERKNQTFPQLNEYSKSSSHTS